MSEKSENDWFRKIAGVLLVAALAYGSFPIVKQWIAPAAQAKR